MYPASRIYIHAAYPTRSTTQVEAWNICVHVELWNILAPNLQLVYTENSTMTAIELPMPTLQVEIRVLVE